MVMNLMIDLHGPTACLLACRDQLQLFDHNSKPIEAPVLAVGSGKERASASVCDRAGLDEPACSRSSLAVIHEFSGTGPGQPQAEAAAVSAGLLDPAARACPWWPD